MTKTRQKDQRWSREELKIYVLLLCSEADFVQTPTELRFISTRVDGESFDRIYNEYLNDSENERIRKIRNALEHHEFSKDEREELKTEIHEMFLANDYISESERKLEEMLMEILG
ncbi:hypothetical protein MKO06_01690 [Gramella sp. GC03-9]|uniref:Uncharacterized protein n=1 Tax=Christiangramia oceanisediminis TaxID=2920386 RepID=A0A9X2KVE4_9FLAO|nr:hypothetical protein [Gramella oceanisediminis]MCP9198600.1 hypothetical protein [Gramella oceanisediminis]